MTDALAVGDEIVITVGPMVHGGHCIGHVGQHTVFVRYAMPGEKVRARIDRRQGGVRFASAVDVLQADDQRVSAPCTSFGLGACGGCDWQFAPLSVQRQWKRAVLEDAFRRQGGGRVAAQVDWQSFSVEPLEPGSDSGLGWRTRARWRSDAQGRPAFRRAGSHALIAIPDCPVLVPALRGALHSPTPTLHAPAGSDLVAQAGVNGELALEISGHEGDQAEVTSKVTVSVRDRTWRMQPGSFWQAHQGLPEALVATVLDFGQPAPGQCWWDLYSGVGLFSAFLGEAVGSSGTVDAVESSPLADRIARRSLHDLPQVHLHQRRVEQWLVSAMTATVHGVVVDPPRRGLGALVQPLCAASPQRIVLVACDPVALARDARLFSEVGYRLRALRAFDAFPMTHHLECVALFTR
jgi:tRNA/tmRNA/rRNA uracil-C5-methylase (TrmA/RlmC/RlmD family)